MVVGSMTVETDVAVIGGGPGGYVAAIRASQFGLDVMIIEKEKELGGICLNHGCIPSKALIHAASVYHSLPKLTAMGIDAKGSVDMEKLREWKRGVVSKLNNGVAALCKKRGIEVIEGVAQFKSSDEIHISGKSDVTNVRFKSAIIATGSSPIQVPGFDFGGDIMSSKETLDLSEIPEKLVVIGGGYIGTELGIVMGKLGSEVHIVEAQDRLLGMMDKEAVDIVTKKLDSYNVKIHLSSKAESFSDGKVSIDQNNNKAELEADKVLVAVGTTPNSKDLGLENTKVRVEKGFIRTDDKMRTDDPKIFAIGDVTGQPMLAHRASRQGKVAAEVIAGKKSAYDNKIVPFVVFTDPEIASAGLSVEEAEKAGYNVKIGKFPFSALGRALTLNETEGFVKYVADDNGIVLGVTIVGPGASDLISEASLAIEMGATLEDIALTIHPHPTLGESMMEAAEAALDSSVHIFGK